MEARIGSRLRRDDAHNLKVAGAAAECGATAGKTTLRDGFGQVETGQKLLVRKGCGTVDTDTSDAKISQGEHKERDGKSSQRYDETTRGLTKPAR